MQVEKVLSNSIITPKVTGYTAAVGLGVSFITGLSHRRTLKKIHKPISIVTVFTTIWHIAQIEYLEHKYKNNKVKN